MLHGTAPFDDKSEKQKVELILQLSPTKLGNDKSPLNFNASLTEDVKDLIISLMRVDPVKRFTFDDIFNHNWIIKYADRFDINLDRLRCKEKLLNEFIDDCSAYNVMKNCQFRETEIERYEKFDREYTNETKNMSENTYESRNFNLDMEEKISVNEFTENYRTEDLLKTESNKENIYLDTNIDYQSENFEYNLKSLTKNSSPKTSNKKLYSKKVLAEITNFATGKVMIKKQDLDDSKRSS